MRKPIDPLDQPNPVKTMDSVDALELMATSLRLFRTGLPATPDFVARLREQKNRHEWALRRVIGREHL